MRKTMSSAEFGEKLDALISAWCSRKELRPLRRILNGSAALNGLTDGWAALLEELRTIRAQDRKVLTDVEFDLLVELQQEVQSHVL
jgi:hypothetical protein